MHIEVTSSDQQIEENYFFEAVPNKLVEDKEYKEMLTKW